VIVRTQLTFAVVALFLVTAAASTAADGPSISVTDQLVTESDSGTRSALFTVRLSAPAAGPVTVDYVTADDSAVAPDDYASAAGTVTFAPGETVREVGVEVVGDTLDEPHEIFSLNLSNPTGAMLGDARGMGTIVDNDEAVSVAVDDVSAPEASGNAGFTVSLGAASGKVIAVAYATSDGSAVAPDDYAARNGTLIFLAGERTKTVAVPLQNDDLVEPDETFAVTLSSAFNAVPADAQGIGTITNDDATTPPPPPPPEEEPPPPPEEPPPPPPPAEEPPPPSEEETPTGEDPPGEEEPPGEEPPPTPPANEAPDCSAAAPSTPRLWSPNHTFRLITLGGATDPDGDPLSYELDGVTQDEPRGKAPDARHGEAGYELWLRAERLGKGNGRVYRIAFQAWDDHGNWCSGDASVTVPHDRDHPHAVDSGGVWSSF
jgi:outer membrane biosynthesis protein TonB